MNKKRLLKAIVNDKTDHPERTSATLERVLEVLENIMGDGYPKAASAIHETLGMVDSRQPLPEVIADPLVDIIDMLGLSQRDINALIEQLFYAEIATLEAIALHEAYKIPVSALEKDIVPVKGDGAWIMDTKGRWFLDMDSNYSATNLGMANPEIARGLFNQANLLISMKEDRVQIARTRFLKNTMEMMPDGLDRFYWQNSGGEAVDKALKIAKAYTGQTGVIAFKNGFHGRTHGAVAVTWNMKYRAPFGLDKQDWVHFAEFNDIDSVKQVSNKTGARIIIIELVQGEEAGNLPADQQFVNALWDLGRNNDMIIIVDEIQSGFGRTAVKKGDWFASTSYGVVPDIMTIGKSFGGGYPVTAVVSTKSISDSMQPGYDGSTFGGNPMAMTAAFIATRQMREMDITGNVIERSTQIFKGLDALRKKHNEIGNIRGRGLMFAFSLGSANRVTEVQERLMANGIKTSLSTGEFIRFLPPTILSEGEADHFLQCLDKALTEVEDNRNTSTTE